MKEFKKFEMVIGDVPELANVVFNWLQTESTPETIMADQPLSVASLIAGHLNRAYSFGFARGRDYTKLAILQGLGFNDPIVDG
jgi:hypothetical protein